MNLSQNLFQQLAKAWRDMHRTARPAHAGKHYAGHRGQGAMGRRSHARLRAARKRERRARLYARACMSGRKHRYGRP